MISANFAQVSQSVTLNILYYIPRDQGKKPLEIHSPFIGQKPQTLHGTGLLQRYIFQTTDKPDVDDPRLLKIFNDLVLARNGIVRVQSRLNRIHIMTNEGNDTLPQIAPLIIPTREEETNAGMGDLTAAFKSMVPFPKVRKFLQFWERELDGPLHKVQIIPSTMKPQLAVAKTQAFIQ